MHNHFKMKTNFLLLILLSCLIVSCEKNHECECEITTYLAPGQTTADGSTSISKTQVTVFEKSTKRKAKSLCKSYTSWPQSGQKIEAKCKLK